MAHDVFVSYPSADKPIADAVVHGLESEGIRCWIAPRDVPRGQDWAASIIDAIGASRMVVLVFSSATNDSDHILREVREAGDAGIPIVPFRTDEVMPNSALRYYIGGTHWLDAAAGTVEEHLDELSTVVRSLLSDEAPVRRTPAHPLLVPAPTQSWWSRLPQLGRVGIGVATLALAVGAGVLFASRGTEDLPVVTDPPGATESTEVVSDAPDDTTAVSSSDESDSDQVVVETGQISSEIVPSLFAMSIWDAPTKVCRLGDGSIECVDVSPANEDARPAGVAFGDFDEDGEVDLVWATAGDNPGGRVAHEWCRNLGDLQWECIAISGGLELSSAAVGVADMNGDGHLDLVFAGDTTGRDTIERAEICLGSGSGEFECAALPAGDLDVEVGGGPIPHVNALAIDDFDADGILDVVLAGWPENEVCFGLGDGTFACGTLVSESGVGFDDVATGDFDDDGLIDLLLGVNRTPSRFCFNTGGRQFECSDATEPFLNVSRVVAADLDLDGVLDIVFEHSATTTDVDDSRLEICWAPVQRDTPCSLSTLGTTEFLNMHEGRLLVDDLTGDGLPDVVVVQGGGVPAFCPGREAGQVNCDPGFFDGGLFDWFDDRGFRLNVYPTGTAWVPLGGGLAAGLGTEIEFVIANQQGPNPLCSLDPGAPLGNRDLLPADCVTVDGAYGSRDVAVADFNGDGIADLAFANAIVFEDDAVDSMDRVCLGTASGYDCRDVTGGVLQSSAVAAGDFDGDGDQDLVFGHSFADRTTGTTADDQFARLCLGDGTGGFGCAALYTEESGGPPEVSAIEAADLDGDADLDIVMALWPSYENVVCINNGAGGFTCSDVEPEQAFTLGAGLGDFNNDGTVDIYFVNENTPNRLCLGDGFGGFACQDASDPGYLGHGVGIADYDGDGNLDAVLVRGETDSPESAIDQMCLGDGAGGFECSALASSEFRPTQATMAVLPVEGGYLTGPWMTQLCVEDGAGYRCDNLDLGLVDDRGFDLPMHYDRIVLLD